MDIRRFAHFSALCVLILLIAGCLGSSPPARFYLLQPIPAKEVKAQAQLGDEPPLIGVGPVRLPGYLDRPQIVLSSGQNQLKLDEFQRWSEPLKGNFTRVLVENLSRMIPTERVLTFPWQRAFRPGYVIEVAVNQFHVTSEGYSILDAAWTVLEDGKPVYIKQSSYSLPADVRSYEAIVAAQSAALAAFSREIAAYLRNRLLQQPSEKG